MKIIGELPAGDYYVGDPCYAIDDDDWDEFLKRFYAVSKTDDMGVFEFRGHKCFVSGTNIGDGYYGDDHGNNYPVDAGMIGAVPAICCTNGGKSFHFDQPFKVGAETGRWNEDGKKIRIGHLTIDT